MDFSTVTAAQWSYVGVVWLSMMVGKAMSMETRVSMALLLVAVVAPENFAVVGLAALVAAITVKIVFQFTTWTGG